jgi:hypothetical protein
MANRIRCDPATGVVSRLGTVFVLTRDNIGLVPDWVPDGSAMTAGRRHTGDLRRCGHDRIGCGIPAANAASDGGGLMTREDVPELSDYLSTLASAAESR